MKMFSPLLPLALFSILSVTYGQGGSADRTAPPTSASCTPSSCPTNPYNVTYQFCFFSLASEEANVTDGHCPIDSKIFNISQYFNPCDVDNSQVCMWNPFGNIKRANTTISGSYCPIDGTCKNRAGMFHYCDVYNPCLGGLDCNTSFNACIHTKALIISPLAAIAIALGCYAAMVIRKKFMYRHRVRLSDYDLDPQDNGPTNGKKNLTISLPMLVYKPNPISMDFALGDTDRVSKLNKEELRTDDFMLFGGEKK